MNVRALQTPTRAAIRRGEDHPVTTHAPHQSRRDHIDVERRRVDGHRAGVDPSVAVAELGASERLAEALDAGLSHQADDASVGSLAIACGAAERRIRQRIDAGAVAGEEP